MMKVLVLVAHPDDEVIMCGATIDKLVRQGCAVFVTYYTQNNQAYFGDESQEARRARAAREAAKSSEILGFKLNILPFQDMEVGESKGLLIQQTIQEIRRIKPNIIITHHHEDKHIDHRTLGEIVPEANFQSGHALCGGRERWSAKTILQGEIDIERTTPFNFQVVSSVSLENIEMKTKAFMQYESVKDEHGADWEWLTKKLTLVAQLRGKAIGQRYGEAFVLNNYAPVDAYGLSLVVRTLVPTHLSFAGQRAEVYTGGI